MIRTLAVSCSPIPICYTDVGKTAAETAYNEIVMEAVRALYEFSPLVSQQNHSDLSLKALDDALKQLYQNNGIFCALNMVKSAKAKVDHMLAEESHHIHDQTIHKIGAAIDVEVYGAEKVSTTKHRHFQVGLNRA
jgi:uncharacterized protein YcbK (DUF882 family)